MIWVVVAACTVATVLADIRWLRVAQREHYLAGSVSRFAIRWWRHETWLGLLAIIAIAAVPASVLRSSDALFAAVIVGAGPWGLALRGRTSAMVWTTRARRLAVFTAVPQVLLLVLAAVLNQAAIAALVVVVVPLFVDLAAKAATPIEKKTANGFAKKARARLQTVAPTVIGITGSYGKTSTKQYVAHFVAGTKSVLATPASFNNLAGLSRAINEQLSPGTDVFVAEMGAYGPGEIRELCQLAPPSISVITAIGPVHLERFGSEDAIVTAKSEIFETATVAVLNVDDERLAAVAKKLEAEGKKVWRCGSVVPKVDVRVTMAGNTMAVTYKHKVIAEADNVDAPLTNVACAVAVALELGVSTKEIGARLVSLPVPKHRQEVTTTPDGLVVIDDTFNANPASVRRGLALLLDKAPGDHRRVVATPGMVELGTRQPEENKEFATEAAKYATDIVIIGKTNRKALLAGAAAAGLNTVVVDRLPQAVAWVRQHVSEGDAVLYANDLPDHFP